MLTLLLALIHIGDVARIMIYAVRFNGFVELEPWLPFLAMWGVSFACLGVIYLVRSRWAQCAGLIGLLANALIGFAGGYIEALPIG